MGIWNVDTMLKLPPKIRILFQYQFFIHPQNRYIYTPKILILEMFIHRICYQARKFSYSHISHPPFKFHYPRNLLQAEEKMTPQNYSFQDLLILWFYINKKSLNFSDHRPL